MPASQLDTEEKIIFSVSAGTARGLMARPRLANNLSAYKEDIQRINVIVTNESSNGVLVFADILDIDTTMFDELQRPWDVDRIGYTFKWPADGLVIWPLANKIYRIEVLFLDNADLTYRHVWEAHTLAR